MVLRPEREFDPPRQRRRYKRQADCMGIIPARLVAPLGISYLGSALAICDARKERGTHDSGLDSTPGPSAAGPCPE